jgi:hypothetical protein
MQGGEAMNPKDYSGTNNAGKLPTVNMGDWEPIPFNEFQQAADVLYKHLGDDQSIPALRKELFDVMMEARMHHWRSGMQDGREIYGYYNRINPEEKE